MRQLVAFDLAGGPRFVRALEDAWAAGDAVLPVDQRLPDAAKTELVTRLGATRLLNAEGSVLLDGWPVEDGDALVVATSGTTGRPKGAVLTHGAIAASAAITSEALGADPASDHWLACLPLAHIGGLSVVTRALITGTPLTVHPRFDPDAVAAAATDGATLVSLVVATLPRVDAGLFRTVLLGGSAIPSERPENTVATYGMTETGSGIVYEGYALRGVTVRIDTSGEIQVRSPTLLRSYRDGSRPFTADGWLRTGDAGSLAGDGRLTVHGRMADVIVSGGEKVWPVAVERELRRLAWVAEVVVAGRPDDEWGQRVVAIVVPVRGATTPSLAELRDQLGARLPRYALPRELQIVDTLPRTSSGKVRRQSV